MFCVHSKRLHVIRNTLFMQHKIPQDYLGYIYLVIDIILLLLMIIHVAMLISIGSCQFVSLSASVFLQITLPLLRSN